MLAAPATGTAHCGESFLRRQLIVSCGLAWKRLGYPQFLQRPTDSPIDDRDEDFDDPSYPWVPLHPASTGSFYEPRIL
jgi:hypothetical protein